MNNEIKIIELEEEIEHLKNLIKSVDEKLKYIDVRTPWDTSLDTKEKLNEEKNKLLNDIETKEMKIEELSYNRKNMTAQDLKNILEEK